MEPDDYPEDLVRFVGVGGTVYVLFDVEGALLGAGIYAEAFGYT